MGVGHHCAGWELFGSHTWQIITLLQDYTTCSEYLERSTSLAEHTHPSLSLPLQGTGLGVSAANSSPEEFLHQSLHEGALLVVSGATCTGHHSTQCAVKGSDVQIQDIDIEFNSVSASSIASTHHDLLQCSRSNASQELPAHSSLPPSSEHVLHNHFSHTVHTQHCCSPGCTRSSLVEVVNSTLG